MVLKFDINNNKCKIRLEKFPNAIINSSVEEVDLLNKEKENPKDVIINLFKLLEFSDNELENAKNNLNDLLTYIFNEQFVDIESDEKSEELILEEKNDDD